MSEEQFQNETNYYIATEMLKNLLKNKLISLEEYTKTDLLNRKSFKPKLAEIMA